MYLFLVFLLFFFHFVSMYCILYAEEGLPFFFSFFNIIFFLLVNTCLFFSFLCKAKHLVKARHFLLYRSVPRRGASPVSHLRALCPELRVIYLTWIFKAKHFLPLMGLRPSIFFFNLIFLSFSYLEHSIFQYLRTSRETARAVSLSLIVTNIIIFPEILYPVVVYSSLY